MRDFDFEDKKDPEVVTGNLEEKQARKFEKEMNRKLRKKKKGSVYDDGYDTHKTPQYKRERKHTRDFL